VFQSPQTSRDELRRQVLRQREEFVAVLEPNYRFRTLLHRQAMADRIAQEAAESQ
jgi:hypothetical protein